MTPSLKTEIAELLGYILLPGGEEVIRRMRREFLGRVAAAQTLLAAEEAADVVMADLPAIGDVRAGVTYGPEGSLTGDLVLPPVGDVTPVNYGYEGEFTGTFVVPIEADVKFEVGYGEDGTEFTGTYAP